MWELKELRVSRRDARWHLDRNRLRTHTCAPQQILSLFAGSEAPGYLDFVPVPLCASQSAHVISSKSSNVLKFNLLLSRFGVFKLERKMINL